MENILLKKYLSKNLINYYKPDSANVMYCTLENMTRSNIVLNRFENLNSDFDAVIDRKNRIHLVYQDLDKNIIYSVDDGTTAKKYELLKARSVNSVSANNFALIKNNSYIGAVYTINYGGETVLCHHLIDRMSVPEVLDAVDTENKYIAVSDFLGDIYVLYLKNNSEWGYRCFKWSCKAWSEFKPLNIRKGASMLSAIIDEKGILHLCYKADGGMFYKNGRIAFEGFDWQSEKLLTRQHIPPALCPIINKIDGTLSISWAMYDRIMAVLSADNGEVWSKLREIGIANGSSVRKIKFGSANNSINQWFYGYILNNKFNVPFLEKVIDFELKEEHNFNDNFIGIPHNEGHETEEMSKILPFIQDNSENIRSDKSTVKNHSAEIEETKRRIAEEMRIIEFNSNMDIEKSFDFGSGVIIPSVSGRVENSSLENQNKTAVHSICKDSASVFILKSAQDEENSKNKTIKILSNEINGLTNELKKLNSNLENLLQKSVKTLSINKTDRNKKKRRKAILCKTHIKNR